MTTSTQSMNAPLTLSQLDPRADGFDLYIECNDEDLRRPGPSFIRVRVDDQYLEMLNERLDCIVAQKPKSLSEFRKPNKWGAGSYAKLINSWSFIVDSKAGFRYQGRAAGSPVTTSHAVPIDGLINRIRGSSPGEWTTTAEGEIENGFQWYGGSLIFGSKEFLPKVLSECSDVEARQISLNMERHIRESEMAPNAAVVPRTRRTLIL